MDDRQSQEGAEAALARQAAALAPLVSRRAAPRGRTAFAEALAALDDSVRRFDHATGRLSSRANFSVHRQRLGHPGPGDLAGPDLQALRAQVAELRTREQQWRHLRAVLLSICGPRRDPALPLLPAHPPASPAASLATATNAVHLGLHGLLAGPGDRQKAVGNPGYFRDIPYPLAEFLTLALAARRILLAQGRPQPHRFLDIGCGGGITVLAASAFFDRAEGLDHDAEYVARTRRLLGTLHRPGCRAFRADAFDFDAYADYDVLWFYRPVAEDSLLLKLEAHVTRHMRPGALLIAPYDFFRSRAAEHGMVELKHPIWTTGLSGAQARALARRAAGIGAALPVRETEAERARWGWMWPLAAAARAQGFEPG